MVTRVYDIFRFSVNINCVNGNPKQGGQSSGQHDWVHGFPEPVKSFITFVILSQILCGKVQKPHHNCLHKTVSKFILVLL